MIVLVIERETPTTYQETSTGHTVTGHSPAGEWGISLVYLLDHWLFLGTLDGSPIVAGSVDNLIKVF